MDPNQLKELETAAYRSATNIIETVRETKAFGNAWDYMVEMLHTAEIFGWRNCGVAKGVIVNEEVEAITRGHRRAVDEARIMASSGGSNEGPGTVD